jgi:hypothetical protein
MSLEMRLNQSFYEDWLKLITENQIPKKLRLTMNLLKNKKGDDSFELA